MSESHFMSELTLCRNYVMSELETHFMSELTLCRNYFNFMSELLYVGINFMVELLYGGLEFPRFAKISNFMVVFPLCRNFVPLYGRITLCRDGFSENR